MRGRGLLGVACICAAIASKAAAGEAQLVDFTSDLSGLSIEDLANLQVTSVTRTPEPLSRAPAAVYVITAEDIRRSGASSLPEALRLAPNLQVARLGSGSYAISARGFNHNTGTANKLQVMIDGRIVYTPLFSGVFWDEQDVVLADIDRIEVTSGPGGTLWGSNAVDGIVNIITRNSRDTQGALADVNGGSLDQTATFRYGGKAGENTSFRVYGMALRRGSLVKPNGHDIDDSWDKLQGGFRTDWASGGDALTLQGDIFNDVTQNQPHELQNADNSGANILGRWTRSFGSGSTLQTQVYYSRSERRTTSGIVATVNAYDFDGQYSFALGARQNIVIGAGYRVTGDRFAKGPGTSFLSPASKTLQLPSAFLQDQISLSTDLMLTLGVKGENNTYTGIEIMPDARLAWTIFNTDLLWTAVSRAVRTPARFDRDLINPGLLAGGPNFTSEDLLAYELGYRGQPSSTVSFSASAFYNVYDNLRSVEASSAVVFPLVVKNGMRGDTYGIELWGNYAPANWWRLSAGLSTLHKDLHFKPGSRDIFGIKFAGNDPSYQVTARSAMDLPHGVEFDADLRAIDSLPSPKVRSYMEADVRLGWHVTSALELWLAGDNLLHARHTEFINASLPVNEIPRSVTAGARWRF